VVRPQRNGLPQGSVLAPILFNLYSNDLPVTRGRKFIYADGIYLAIQGQYFSELESSYMARMAPKQSAATRELSVYLDGLRLPTQPILGTLDEHCGQAEEPKQLVDEASRFHLGRQRQHSAVICSDALLFSSRVLRPPVWSRSAHTSRVDSHGSPTFNRQLVEKIIKHDSWPPSRKPLWVDLQPVDIKSRWRKSAQVA